LYKVVLPTILVATVIIAGVFAFMPVEKASTVHQTIIDAINAGNTALAIQLLEDLGGGHDDLGIGHSDITAELQDKLKLMNATDTETFVIGQSNPSGPGLVDGYNILVEALDGEKNVNFNLKEVYLCGSGNTILEVQFVHIQNISFDPTFNFVVPDSADITIATLSGANLGENLFEASASGCVDVISELADTGRAGAMGLGSDEELVIEISGSGGDVNFVKCIAFTPNAAEELICDIQPFFELGVAP